MAKIQYNTKKLRVNTPPTPEELFSFNDANEIKASVNFLYDNGADGKYIQATPTEPQAESIVLKKAIDGEDDMILRVSADSVSMKGGMFNQVAWNGALYPHYKEAYLNPDGIGFKTIDKAAETIVGSGYWNSTGFGFDGDGGHAYFNHRGVGASNSQGSYRSGLEGIYFGQSGNGTGYHGGTGMGSSNSFGGVHAAIGSISSSIYGVGNLYHTLESIGINANAGSVSLEKNKLSFYPSGQPTFDEGSIIPNNIGRYDVVTPESFLAVTGTTTLTLPSEGGTIARIEDLPIEEYSATKTYNTNEIVWVTKNDGSRVLYQSTIDNNTDGFSTDAPLVEANVEPITIETGLMFPDEFQQVVYDENLESYFPPVFYGVPEIIRVKLKADDGRAIGFYYQNIQMTATEVTATTKIVIKENINSTQNTEVILSNDFWNGDGFVFYKAVNGNTYKIKVDFSVDILEIDLALVQLLPKWVFLGDKHDDFNTFVKLSPAAMQTGDIRLDGNVRAASANFEAANLVESLIINKTEIPSGQAPITGFGQLLPNKLTFNDNNYNTGYSGDAVYGSGSLSLRINGKGKFILSKLGLINNEVDIKIPDASGTLALLTDIPAAPVIPDFSTLAPKESPTFTGTPKAPKAGLLSNDEQLATTAWIWEHDNYNNISKFGQQEQTGYLTLKNWLTFKKINSWANSTNAGNLSYSDTHRWVFMSSSDSTKNVGFEILPSETRTVIRLTLPTTGGTIARLEDLPNTANFATLNGFNTFTANNAFNGYSNFQGASFQGDVNVNSGKRTTLGGGVDVYQDLSIYSGVGRITMSAAYMGTNQSHAITVPANSGTLALTSDLNAYLRTDDISSYINIDGKTNKTETLSVGATQRNFEANSNNGFRFGITNDQYMGDTNAGMNNFSVGIGSEKREAGYGNLERGKKLSLTHYADGFIFNQYSAPKNNQLAIAFPDFGTTDSTGAHLYFPASVSDGTLTVLSNVTTAPTSANSTGVKGEVIIASGYRYECTSANTWVRSAIETSW